ncbi:MAG: molybdopterin-dependent oxidoreductase [Bacteroidota bacterium]|nr:molybdopterin-dependent oxidoreductase [Bacteroidota bacterium]
MDKDKYAFHSFGAHFVKVKVKPLREIVKVEKVSSAIDTRRILNEKTAKSQIMVGAIFGMGMALIEETIYNENTGRIVTKNLADYFVPVHAAISEFDMMFTDKPDYNIGSIEGQRSGRNWYNKHNS